MIKVNLVLNSIYLNAGIQNVTRHLAQVFDNVCIFCCKDVFFETVALRGQGLVMKSCRLHSSILFKRF